MQMSMFFSTVRRLGLRAGDARYPLSEASVRRLVSRMSRMRGAALKIGQFASMQGQFSNQRRGPSDSSRRRQNPAAPGSSSVTTQSARLDTSRSFPKFVTGAPQLKVPPSEQLSQQPRRWRPAKTQPSSTRSSKPTARRNASKTLQTRYSAGSRAHQPRVRLAVEKRLLDRLHLLVGSQRYVGWNAISLWPVLWG